MHTQSRPLGRLEQYSTARSHLGIYLNVAVTAWYRKPESCAFMGDKLFTALATVIQKHPTLSALPVDIDTESPYFTRLTEVRLEEVVAFIRRPISSHNRCSKDTSTCPILDEILQDQHNRPFQHTTPSMPFWRVLIIEDENDTSYLIIVFIFHHCLADTQSALVFHSDLEAALSDETNTTLTSTIIRPPAVDLLPPLERVHSLPLSPDYLLALSCASRAPHSWSGAPQTLPVKTLFTSFHLSASHTATLLQLSKSHSVSLTAIIQVLIASTIFAILPQAYTFLLADCAVSLRPFLPSPIDSHSMGCYVGSFSTPYTRSSFSWGDVHRTKHIIDATVANNGANMPVGNLRHAGDMLSWFKSKIGKERAVAFELSNVGALKREVTKDSRWNIERMLFSQSASACGGAIKVSVITGKDTCLGFGFTWQDGVIEEDLSKNLVEEFKSELLELLKA